MSVITFSPININERNHEEDRLYYDSDHLPIGTCIACLQSAARETLAMTRRHKLVEKSFLSLSRSSKSQ